MAFLSIKALTKTDSEQTTQNSISDSRYKDDSSHIAQLQDTLNRTRDTLIGFGIKIDSTTGKILLIDSQLLKQRVTQIINNNFFSSSSNEDKIKLDKFFSDLRSSDYNKREIALNYVLSHFPDTLSDSQIRDVGNYIEVSNISPPLLDLLSTQPKLKSLIELMKNVVQNKMPLSNYAWSYLFKNDKNLPLSFVESQIKARQNYFINYQNIVQLAMDNNDKICMPLLSDRDLIGFLIANQNDSTESVQAHVWIRKMIERKPEYNKYRNTYFYKNISE